MSKRRVAVKDRQRPSILDQPQRFGDIVRHHPVTSNHAEGLVIALGRLLADYQLPEDKLVLHPLIERAISTIGTLGAANDYMGKLYLRTKQENEILYRWLAAIIEQNGGALQVSEEIWLRTDHTRRIRAHVLDGTADTLLALTEDELVEILPPIWLTNALKGVYREEDWAKRPEPQYLPAFEVQKIEAEIVPSADVRSRAPSPDEGFQVHRLEPTSTLASPSQQETLTPSQGQTPPPAPPPLVNVKPLAMG